jgi:soluble lytic murein transglycosylase-like protein
MIIKASLHPIPRRLLPAILLLASLASLWCQEGGAFGLDAKGLAALLAGQDASPALGISPEALDDTGVFGPSAYYYLARWIDSRELSAPGSSEGPAKARLLYRLAFDRAAGIARKEAGLALIDRLRSALSWEELLDASSDFAEWIGPEWKSERPRLDALDALGRGPETIALVARLGSAYAAEAAKDADALAYFGAVADMRGSGKAWPKAFRRLLLERPGSEWTARAFALSATEPRLRALFSSDELHALAMRDALLRKDYSLAYGETLLGPFAAMGRGASQAMIADAGKAFLYSGSLKQGEGGFTAEGWTARFYKARFARSLERWAEAAALFKKAALDAPTKADADSCRWYEADSSYRGALAAAASKGSALARAAAEAAARKDALDGLVAASASWRDPLAFSDLASGLYRDALRARDWALVEAMAARLAPKLAPEMGVRLSYAAARAMELGLGTGKEGGDPELRASRAAARFAAITAAAAAPLHYRALAAWRSGAEPVFLPPEPAKEQASTGAAPEAAESFVAGLASFGLCDIAQAEARSRRAALSDDALRRLAALFASLGRPDCALRLALDLTSRSGYAPRRSDYELLYPRPYLEEIRSLELKEKVGEPLALGLIRSESIFRTDVVSSAGAIGLSQLMPATAAEQAKALGLASYDLKSPRDNLAIGLAHFAELLGRTGGRPLRAMMAYNAGWGRLRTWSAESGDLPDDLMLEALGIDETRQYCRNILQATVVYGQLYYGKTIAETVGELVEGAKADSPTK